MSHLLDARVVGGIQADAVGSQQLVSNRVLFAVKVTSYPPEPLQWSDMVNEEVPRTYAMFRHGQSMRKPTRTSAMVRHGQSMRKSRASAMVRHGQSMRKSHAPEKT